MKSYIILLCSVLALVSCHRQNKAPNSTAPPVSLGDTVQNIAKGAMVIYQDTKNNYWFGGGQGAYKYDGKTTLQFTTKDGLISNEIWGIQEDRAGNIYFDTQDGVSKFDGQSFSTLSVDSSSVNDWKLEADDLWFKGNWNKNGVYRFDGKQLHLLVFPKNERADELKVAFPNMIWSPYGIYTTYKDKKGNIWFGTSNLGIYRYDGKNLSLLYEDHLTNTPSGGSFGIRSIFEDTQGKFWFCNTRYRYNILPDDAVTNDRHLIHYEREKGIDQVKSAKGEDLIYFMSVTEDDKHKLWMLTYSEGVWRYDGKNMTHYPVKNGAADITLFSIYKDRRGDLWLGTHEAGAYKFNGDTFEKFSF